MPPPPPSDTVPYSPTLEVIRLLMETRATSKSISKLQHAVPKKVATAVAAADKYTIKAFDDVDGDPDP
jgi:hypothetical protein